MSSMPISSGFSNLEDMDEAFPSLIFSTKILWRAEPDAPVSRHPIFQRQDVHLFSTAPSAFAQAALGGDVRIKTIDGDVLYNIKPGTKTDTKVRLKGKGVPSLRNPQVRGDHYVTLVIQTPEKLSAEAKEALRKFDELTGNSLNQEEEPEGKTKNKKKGFMDKVKEKLEELEE